LKEQIKKPHRLIYSSHPQWKVSINGIPNTKIDDYRL